MHLIIVWTRVFFFKLTGETIRAVSGQLHLPESCFASKYFHQKLKHICFLNLKVTQGFTYFHPEIQESLLKL